MSLSWDESRPDHIIAFFLESLAKEQSPQSPLACHVCDKIILDKTILLEHFLSHFSQDGTLKGSQHAEGSHENKEPCVWRSVSPNSPSPTFGDGTFAAQPHQSSNFHTRFASHAAGLKSPRAPIRPTGPDSSTSKGSDQSDFSFWPSDPGTSSSGLSLAKAIAHPQTTREGSAKVPICAYTRPYINQLERPIQETLAVLEDVGGNNKPDEMDLTLKL